MTQMDDFVDIVPRPQKSAASKPAITVTTIQLRQAAPALSLSFSIEAARALGDGRVTVSWSEKATTLRLRADAEGLFALRPNRGGRRLLRLPLPSGLRHRKGLVEPCPRREDGGLLYLIVPPTFRQPPDPAAAAKAAIAAAKAAAPAPDFSGPGRRKPA